MHHPALLPTDPSTFFLTLLFLSTNLPTLTSAHGFVQYITTTSPQNLTLRGYDPGFRFQDPPPSVPSWYADNPDIGYVPPQNFSHPDIVCHRSARPGQEYVTVAAGSALTLQWLTWPESHVGPILDYLAPCPPAADGGCVGGIVDKTALKFVKLAQRGLKDDATPATDWLKAWAVDDFIRGGFKWEVKVPADLKAGLYVLRHEILALHGAWDVNGAQAYPQCVNLNVTGGGGTEIGGKGEQEEGLEATKFYTAEDPGLRINVYGGLAEYPFPGPKVWR